MDSPPTTQDSATKERKPKTPLHSYVRQPVLISDVTPSAKAPRKGVDQMNSSEYSVRYVSDHSDYTSCEEDSDDDEDSECSWVCEESGYPEKKKSGVQQQELVSIEKVPKPFRATAHTKVNYDATESYSLTEIEQIMIEMSISGKSSSIIKPKQHEPRQELARNKKKGGPESFTGTTAKEDMEDKEGIMEMFQAQMDATIPKVRWNQIFGNDNVKEALKSLYVPSSKNFSWMYKPKKTSGVLLYGSPGVVSKLSLSD